MAPAQKCAPYPREMVRNRGWLGCVAAVAAVVVTAATGCGEQSAQRTAPPTTSGLDAFCASVAALDETDGTTDAAVTLAAIDDLRNTAPDEIRVDIDLVADTLIVNNYPERAEPSMRAAPFDDLDPARARLASYVKQNCDAGR